MNKHGRPLLHKGKKNSNGTFSKGKTWQLDDMRVLEQIGVSPHEEGVVCESPPLLHPAREKLMCSPSTLRSR